MATSTITYEIAATCSTGDHGTLTIKQDNVMLKTYVGLHWQDLKDFDYTNEELQRAFLMLGREMVKRAGSTTKAQVANKINSMSITFTF